MKPNGNISYKTIFKYMDINDLKKIIKYKI